MAFHIVSAALLTMLLQAAPPAQAPAPPTRAEALRGEYGKLRSNNDLLTYKLDVRVDPVKKLISGKNTITFRMLNDDSRVQIDLYANLNVDKILMGATPLKFERELNAVFIDFPAPVKAGREIALDFYYSGTPKTIGRFGGFTFSQDPAGRPWIFTACEGEGSSIWFPSKDQWRDEVESMDISVAIPSALTDVSNGRFVGTKDLGDGYTQWNYHVSYPINSYDISLNIGAYEHFSDTLGPLSLDFYSLPEDLDKAKAQFAQAKPMIEAFAHYFGEYPFVRDGYKLIQVPYTGMEHQSAVTYGNGFRNGYGGRDFTGAGINPKFDYIIIHESGHEWFGNAVSAADVSDMWIQEGWCIYLEMMYVEQMFGHDDAMTYANSYKAKVQNKTPVIATRGRHQEPPQDMYFKGGLMLNTMRSVMNDDAKWWALVKETYQTFKYKNILTEEMATLFTKRFGRNMTPLFNQYLRHAAIPVLELVIDERRGKVAYRWKADETAFAMPIRVGARSAWETITPTTTWQQIDSKLTYDTFAVATDLYYVNVSKADGPYPAELLISSSPAPTGGAAAPRAVPPEQQAYNDAAKIKDLNERLTAYRKIQADYPTSTFLRMVNSTILNQLIGMPDKQAEIAPAFEKVATDTTTNPAYAPEIQVLLLTSPIARMLDKNVAPASAETTLKSAVGKLDKDKNKSAWASGTELVGRLHLAAGDSAIAEQELADALAADPSLKSAPVALAEMNAKRGDDKRALDFYMKAAAAGLLSAEKETTARALYKKVRRNDKGYDADVNHTFKTAFANPVTPELWKGSALRTTRIPLLELFTGSACPPCVAADYALDAVMARYAPKDIAVLAYHVHIPGPDPMTTAASAARKDYYKKYVLGVPTFIVDGALGRLGGGGRDNAGATYGVYVPAIDAALTAPAEAMLALNATEHKGKITVTTTIADVAAGFKNLKLHVVVAEQELAFSGENGMRFHPLVVRAMAGGETPGLDVTLDAAGRASIDATLDLAAIADDITKSLEAEIKKRRGSETAGSTPAVYKAEGHPMTSVDVKKLVVVAFLQDDDKHVLQSVQGRIK